jgi:pimeloyl-ACP methyl ester carboxylesterase
MFITLSDGLRLFYEDQGQGEPVVLVHGLRCSHVTWRHQIPVLAERYRVIAPDIRGHGDSDKPAGPYTVDLWISDLVQLLDQLELPRVVLIGHSLGAGLVQAFAFAHQDRLRGMALIATSPERSPRVSENLKKSAEIAQRERRLPPAEATVRARLGKGFAEAHPDEVLIEARSMVSDPLAYAASCLANSGHRSWTARLHEITIPVLYMGGDEDRADVAANARIYGEHLPDVETHVLPGVGHFVPFEAPDTVNELLLGFLERVHARQ